MEKDEIFPSYPPMFFVRLTERIRQWFLRMNRRLTHPNVVLWEMIHNFWLAAGISVASELGIADHLKEEPRTVEELAGVTGTDCDSLYRVLRMLSSQGIFRELKGKRFASTKLSEPLRDEQIRHLLMLHLTPGHFRIFGDLLTSVKTGRPVTGDKGGSALFDHIGNDQERNERFNKAMSNASKMQASAIIDAYSFKPYSQIVDLGGGQGYFLSAILRHSPASNGILFDLPGALVHAETVTGSPSLNGRMKAIPGDFFSEVPGGGDLYILKSVIHDWDDEDALKILANIHRAMDPAARLLIIESMIGKANRPSFGKMTDILMMAAAGGMERTRIQFEHLLRKAGFRIRKYYPTLTPHTIIEAEKV